MNDLQNIITERVDDRKRNKKVSVVMICSPSRGTLEGAMHHGLRVAHCCREGRYQQPRGDQAGHDHQLRSAVSNRYSRTLIGSRALTAYGDVDGPSAANSRPW